MLSNLYHTNRPPIACGEIYVSPAETFRSSLEHVDQAPRKRLYALIPYQA
jgi:hypothetical protein